MHEKYGVQAWLLVACNILQPLYKYVPQDVHRSYEQVTQNFNFVTLIAATSTGWLTSIKHAPTRKQSYRFFVIASLSFWTLNLPRC